MPLQERGARPSGGSIAMRVAGLFAGIGGIELGLEKAGFESKLLCEIEPAAQEVLRVRFDEEIPLVEDVRDLASLPSVDLVAAGFPCQDLSQAGRTAGITGERSGLVDEVFRLLADARSVRWLLLENVPFMLQLERGEAMRFLTRSLEALGWRWAYRVVDARAFGLPQRRQRVLMLASRDEDPRTVLFPEDAGAPPEEYAEGLACGFYWTEGVRGLGWAINAVPTLKGGSTIGIPSPPAIWMPDGNFVTPDLRDAERLQGFPVDWTKPAEEAAARRSVGARWKLVGNAVSVTVAQWLGEQLVDPQEYDSSKDPQLGEHDRWPSAAWGEDGITWRAQVSMWPRHELRRDLGEFLQFPTTPLSPRATAGFLSRARRGRLRFPNGFIADLERHLERASADAQAA